MDGAQIANALDGLIILGLVMCGTAVFFIHRKYPPRR